MLPVVQQLVKLCKGTLGEWSHWGATTQDITDTATILQIREALDIVEKEIDDIADALATLAKKYRDTPMAGRSNLQQAVPITFGYKMATLLAAFERHKQRLKELRARVLVGEFGGAAGTLSSLGKDGLEVPGRTDEGTRSSASPRLPGTPCATASPKSAASSAWSPAPAARSPST